MLSSSVHLPPRLLQLIGALGIGSFIVSFVMEALKERKESPPDIQLATSHPAVPTNLFSSMFERENRPNLRRHEGDRWLFAYGDKVCQSTLSLLLCISQGAKLPSSDPETRKGLFALYLQAALAETRLQMVSLGRWSKDSEAMLDCVSLTILDASLGQLERYNSLLALGENERIQTVTREAVRSLGAPDSLEKHFGAAYLLLRTVARLLVLSR